MKFINQILNKIKGKTSPKPKYEEYAAIGDYRKIGINCTILESNLPSFIWNIDEKKILQYPDTWGVNNGRFEVKSGNRIINVLTCLDEIPEDIMKKINSGYGIAIMNHSLGEVECPRSEKVYRFGILES